MGERETFPVPAATRRVVVFVNGEPYRQTIAYRDGRWQIVKYQLLPDPRDQEAPVFVQLA